MKISAIIPAAGSGSRFSLQKNKLLENITGIPVIVHTLRVIASVDAINEIIICSSIDLIEKIQELIVNYNISKTIQVIEGGESRQESVFIGLKTLHNPDFVVIHDGARPFVSKEIIENTINTARQKGAATAAIPTKDTIKRVDNKTRQIIETLNRNELWNIQTPQVFKYQEILKAHQKFAGQKFTDDSALIEKMGISVFIETGSYKNIKITTLEDIYN